MQTTLARRLLCSGQTGSTIETAARCRRLRKGNRAGAKQLMTVCGRGLDVGRHRRRVPDESQSMDWRRENRRGDSAAHQHREQRLAKSNVQTEQRASMAFKSALPNAVSRMINGNLMAT